MAISPLHHAFVSTALKPTPPSSRARRPAPHAARPRAGDAHRDTRGARGVPPLCQRRELLRGRHPRVRLLRPRPKGGLVACARLCRGALLARHPYQARASSPITLGRRIMSAALGCPFGHRRLCSSRSPSPRVSSPSSPTSRSRASRRGSAWRRQRPPRSRPAAICAVGKLDEPALRSQVMVMATSKENTRKKTDACLPQRN